MQEQTCSHYEIGQLGQNLIFIISQPRAGSTLLQRILGGHPAIHTLSEPWLMLHPLYALRSHGYDAEYDSKRAKLALSGFLKSLPHGDADYVEAIRLMCTHLYSSALKGTSKQYFLDKTPRYYLIIPELFRTFPNATYIILLRNPLSVLNSMLTNWIMEQLSLLYSFKGDLLSAPRRLVEGIDLLGDRAVVLKYEELVANPEEQTRLVCQRLEIEWKPDILNYNESNLPRWTLGDTKEIYRRSRPVPENAQKWIGTLKDPQVWRLANEYLEALGEPIIERMGYSYSDLHHVLETHRPKRTLLWPTFSMAQFMTRPSEIRRKGQRAVARFAAWVHPESLRVMANGKET